MIISQTPFRISFFGGGTDYPAWYRENGGAVLSTTIDKYCYLSCRHLPPFFGHKHRVVYSLVETVNSLDEIKHPSAREVLKYLKVREGIEIHHDGDLPARSGIGSSSAFTVGLLNTLFALRGKIISKQQLAELAIHIEQNVIGETVGSQDQISTAFGGLNRIDFHSDDTFSVRPMILPRSRQQDLQNHLMLFFTGLSRTAEVVAKTQISNFGKRQGHLRRMHQMVDEGADLLQGSEASLQDFGSLLHEGWRLKRELSSEVSNAKIDEVYESALAGGALGGKLIGAGGGGFVLLFVPPEKQGQVRQRLEGLLEVSFKFENLGSRIVLYQPELGDVRNPESHLDLGKEPEA